MSCGRAQEFLARTSLTPAEQVDAKKKVFGREKALELLAAADTLMVAKGKKVVEVELKKTKPRLDDLVPLLLGPTGNLRAPLLRTGRKLLVGFDAEAYERLLA